MRKDRPDSDEGCTPKDRSLQNRHQYIINFKHLKEVESQSDFYMKTKGVIKKNKPKTPFFFDTLVILVRGY